MAWVWWTLSGVLALAAAWALVALLIGDRSRGRRRCPRCWHSMEGLPRRDGEGGWVCPECGKTVTRERHLFRTRRKTRVLVVLGVAALSGSAWYGHGVYERRAEGVRAWIPSLGAVLLVRPVRNHGGYPEWSQVLREVIVARRGTPTLPNWHEDLLEWRLVDASEDAAWAHVHLRDVWVRGEPIPVSVSRPDLSGGLFVEQIELIASSHRSQIFAGRGAVFYSGPPSQSAGVTPWISPAVSVSMSFSKTTIASSDIVDLELNSYFVGRGPAALSPARTRQAAYRRSFNVRLVDSFDELAESGVIEPVRNSEYDARHHPIRFVRFDGMGTVDFGRLTLGLPEDLRRAERARGFINLFEIELVHEGVALTRSIRSFPAESPVRDLRDRFIIPDTIDDAWTEELDAEFEAWVRWHRYQRVKGLGEEPDMTGWSIRATPRPDLVLWLPRYDRYWAPADGSASLEIPLNELDEPVRSAWPAELFDARTPPPSPP